MGTHYEIIAPVTGKVIARTLAREHYAAGNADHDAPLTESQAGPAWSRISSSLEWAAESSEMLGLLA